MGPSAIGSGFLLTLLLTYTRKTAYYGQETAPFLTAAGKGAYFTYSSQMNGLFHPVLLFSFGKIHSLSLQARINKLHNHV